MDPLAARWDAQHVLALAGTPARAAAAEATAVASRWSSLGGDGSALWGRCRGASAEPYEVAVHHAPPAGGELASRCSCPARVTPCKHALALMLLWVRGEVPTAHTPAHVQRWVAHRIVPTPAVAPTGAPQPAVAPRVPVSPPMERTARDRRRDERMARVAAGLTELDRWIADRLRTGLADPELARYATWDRLAARLVDAQAQGLANRVRRLGGVVGTRPRWHDDLLAELGILHLLAEGGRRLSALPHDLADGVAAAVGWQVRQADVLAGVPDTDHWVVAGRSDTREDRIVVRRIWLWGRRRCRWAMLLSFAAYGQQLDESLAPGDELHADLHRYPGPSGLRALVGSIHGTPAPSVDGPAASSVSEACAAVGDALAAEPWLERWPVTIRAAVTHGQHGERWYLTDGEGSVPLVSGAPGLPTALACTVDGPRPITAEWTPVGFLPLSVHLPDRLAEIGPSYDDLAA